LRFARPLIYREWWPRVSGAGQQQIRATNRKRSNMPTLNPYLNFARLNCSFNNIEGSL